MYNKKQKHYQSSMPRTSFEDIIKIIAKVTSEKRYARITKFNIDGEIDDFIAYASDRGYDLVEQDERVMIFGDAKAIAFTFNEE